MQVENNSSPISIAERRASRSLNANQALSPERQAAYRQLALTVLGLDVQTLTSELRARRLQREAPLRLVSRSDRAA